jgi:hypothetical protein
MHMHEAPITLKTPTSANGLERMRGTLDDILSTMSDDESKLHVQKLYNAAEQSLANCALLADENKSLVEQNCEKKARQAVRATIPGPAKIMTYEDIVRARRVREEKAAGVVTSSGSGGCRAPNCSRRTVRALRGVSLLLMPVYTVVIYLGCRVLCCSCRLDSWECDVYHR